MKTLVKLSSRERRADIIRAVRRVFAEKGFDGTTTRELAEAAGVSEALLFKHFPNKEALYLAMQTSCCMDRDPGLMERIQAMRPSAKSLVQLIQYFVWHVIAEPPADDQEALQTRMMLRSLSEDGEFARTFLKGNPLEANMKLRECIRAAVAAGEAVDGKVRSDLAGWFAQNLMAMLKIMLLPDEPVIDFGASRQKLAEQAVWFILRGMGLKDQTIQRYYRPGAGAAEL
ncbi:MAG TPA: helix-turn-helix domain-containing protein [Tepidisphaeraceae bacterium]|nr:helix-turn-helix domain-containing protein [Tepidisphaeraceae bacterium]